MNKKIGPVELFWLNAHMDTMTVSEMARTLGVTYSTVQNALTKIKGKNRSGDSKDTAEKVLPATKELREEKLKNDALRKEPAVRFDALIHNKNSSGEKSGAVAMTPQGSMFGDDVAAGKINNIPVAYDPFSDSTRVYKIRADE